MENDAATLYCPNELCQSPNPLSHKFCLRCSTPLPKRYLWVEGEGLNVAVPGEILADRYLVIDKSVVIDIRPGFVPEAPELENLSVLRPYLRLIPYRLHVPQVYGVIPPIDGRSTQEILLLEKPPLFADSTGQQVELYPDLITAWNHATSIRQLHLLWQLANLWQPLSSEGVASSLFEPDLMRVEGPLVRLLALRSDSATAPSLSKLGEFWRQLEQSAKPAIADLIRNINNSLIAQEIHSSEQLITVLDQGLAQLGRSQTSSIKIFTKTDTGPTRQRNEDACYPASGTLVSKPPQQTALAIVCDGIGGHEGGNVASNLAIETIQQQVQQLTTVPSEHIDPAFLLRDLDSAVGIANDKISQRNDGENRQGRQRMGTTLVMALPIAHEMYITHVGDSRAYWITRQGCYQVTLDDDVASREVRLGYAIYREATQQSGSGSLVQALGMSPSSSLHPTSQRFILDEDGVFLLTSDGLSDFDRVEDYWETEVLPILTGETDVASVTEKLVEIANTKNGHDNVTIALVHYQVKYIEPKSNLTVVIPDTLSTTSTDTSARTAQGTLLNSSNAKTQVITEEDKPPAKSAKLPLHLIVPLIIVAAAAGIGYWYREQRTSPLATVNTTATPTPTVPATPQNPPELRTIDNIDKGWVIQTTTAIPLENKETLPAKNYLQVIEKKANLEPAINKDFLVDLELCRQKNVSNSPQQDLPTGQQPKRITFSQDQLKKYKVNVLQPDQSNPCVLPSPAPVDQPPAPTPQPEVNPNPTDSDTQ